MLMYPSVRKGLITEPNSSFPFNHSTFDNVRIQDDQIPPELIQDPSLQCYQQQPQLQSPFQYHPDLQFVSPPSSAPSSPTFSSPTFSTVYPQATTVSTGYPAVVDGSFLEAPSMTPASSYNPSIHIQHSTSPPPQQQQPYFAHYPFDTPMLAQQSVASNHGWGDSSLQAFDPTRFQNSLSRAAEVQSHKKSPSSSSSGSAPGDSFRTPNNGATVSKPLPTPVQTPVQNSFLAAPFQNYDPSTQDASHTEAEIAMRRAIMEQQQQQQQPSQQQQNDYSLAPSVSSVSHNSPITPQTTYDEVDDASKVIGNDYGNHNGGSFSIAIPKLNRTISDIYQDELYNAAIIPAPQVPKQPSNQNNLLTPYHRTVFADRLQAANQGHMSARSQSPAMGINRDHSPFRNNSPLAAEFNTSALQQPQMATSMPMAQSGMSIAQHAPNGEPKTMSPKDALLDFNEGDDTSMPTLFPSNQADFNLGDTLGLRRESSSFRPAQNFSPMESFPNQYATQAAGVRLPMAQQQQGLSQPQQQHNNLVNRTPDFPASLPSFDSTGSEAHVVSNMTSPQAPSKLTMQPVNESITRPNGTSADSGTYTCTYHGCTLRFETPAKLQKHKREAHRQTTPGGHLVGRDANMRNSQAGPHKCERINPSTGKPCNSIFSRPYDLTRHEDTIHNARKQKVRCHLCTEEKTFSRNDALTRHMRVVHPEVDWPGKQRRRGRE
jgi:hypothetical protein